MHSKWLPVFYTKSNLNKMASINMCLLKLFYWITLVLTYIIYCCLHHNCAHIMLCITHCCLTKVNSTLLPHVHTENLLFNCSIIIINMILLPSGRIYTVALSTTYMPLPYFIVNFVTRLQYNY